MIGFIQLGGNWVKAILNEKPSDTKLVEAIVIYSPKAVLLDIVSQTVFVPRERVKVLSLNADILRLDQQRRFQESSRGKTSKDYGMKVVENERRADRGCLINEENQHLFRTDSVQLMKRDIEEELRKQKIELLQNTPEENTEEDLMKILSQEEQQEEELKKIAYDFYFSDVEKDDFEEEEEEYDSCGLLNLDVLKSPLE
jgi:hypothetical protein